jgi:ATP-binding cassette, subfamily B, heavy metal transporter
MRRATSRSRVALPVPTTGKRHDWGTVKSLLPYLLQYKLRIFLALSCLVGAKLANVAVPLVFKHVIDALTITPEQALIVVPAALVLAYGVLRFSVSLFTELREVIFARVTQGAVRNVALQVFRHLHTLSMRFHLERQTGGLTRDIERGTRSIGSLISYTLYSILPTLVEIGLVMGVLLAQYEVAFAAITGVTLASYIIFTVWVTNWRTHLRREANEFDSAANTRAIDSLINYETVKYFNNEAFETRRYDAQLRQWETAQVKSQLSLSLLNTGQALIIACGVMAMMWLAASRVSTGAMTLGDIVLVNAFMMQLYIPLNFLGVLYREIRQALTDIERLFLLLNVNQEVSDSPSARSLEPGPCEVRFEQVDFAYESKRQILFDVDFTIPRGKTVAVVGHSGSGKSTLSRLLFRFYDVQNGCVRINGHDIRELTQQSTRAAIGIVPQDTVLFNDTIFYNIQYGRPDAAYEDVVAAAKAAHIFDFIESLPDKFDTRVGERGLKLSGGEKQRVAIARALLKDPPILIFDEATSALDSKTEKAIQAELELAAVGRTTFVVAHRLSTVMNADEILVLDRGKIVERGTHRTLLTRGGTYAQMWALQQREKLSENGEPAGPIATDLVS